MSCAGRTTSMYYILAFLPSKPWDGNPGDAPFFIFHFIYKLTLHQYPTMYKPCHLLSFTSNIGGRVEASRGAEGYSQDGILGLKVSVKSLWFEELLIVTFLLSI